MAAGFHLHLLEWRTATQNGATSLTKIEKDHIIISVPLIRRLFGP
jgi:hypothetical protein